MGYIPSAPLIKFPKPYEISMTEKYLVQNKSTPIYSRTFTFKSGAQISIKFLKNVEVWEASYWDKRKKDGVTIFENSSAEEGPRKAVRRLKISVKLHYDNDFKTVWNKISDGNLYSYRYDWGSSFHGGPPISYKDIEERVTASELQELFGINKGGPK